MHPAYHQAALASFFGRHDITVRFARHIPLFPRLGLALTLAGALNAADFRTLARTDGSLEVNRIRFSADDWFDAMDAASRLAGTSIAIEQGRAPEHNGAPIDRMALLMRQAEAASLTVDADMLARAGIPEHLIAEFALEAAQLAEAMSTAERAYTGFCDARADVEASSIARITALPFATRAPQFAEVA